MTQPPFNHKQMVGGKQKEGGREGAHLFLGARGSVQQFLQLRVHGALQLLPHHFLELSHPFAGHSFTQIWMCEKEEEEDGGQRFTLTCLNSDMIWILKLILASKFIHFID